MPLGWIWLGWVRVRLCLAGPPEVTSPQMRLGWSGQVRIELGEGRSAQIVLNSQTRVRVRVTIRVRVRVKIRVRLGDIGWVGL